ncbi:MAG: DUF2987 domain-containing protein [Aeromonas sp.]
MNRVRHLLLITLFSPVLAQAGTVLDLEYSAFYSQMKTFAKGEFGHARLGFYLSDPLNGQRCTLASAEVTSQGKQLSAKVTFDHELQLPVDSDLNLNKARVFVTLNAPHARCDMVVQVMADVPREAVLPLSDLIVRQQQMQLLLDKMAGRVGKHFLPKMVGVRVALVEPKGMAYLLKGTHQVPIPWHDNQLLLSGELLDQFATGQLQLPNPALRLTPWLHKG